jgi:hypothetical protein
MKNAALLFLLSIIAVACIPEDLEITDIPGPEEKLVVSSSLLPQDSLIFALTKSVNILDPVLNTSLENLIAELAVTEGKVTISGRGETNLLVPVSPGLYTLPGNSLQTDVEYTLNAIDTKTGKSVTAKATKPEPVGFDAVSAKAVLATDDSLARVSYAFQDIPGKSNHYMINVQRINPSEFDERDFLDEEPFTYLLTDAGKDGTRLEGEFTVFDFEGFNTGDTLLLSMANISQDYFDFLSARESDQTGIDLLYEPFNYPTNVNGGYGIFSLHTVDLRVVILEN